MIDPTNKEFREEFLNFLNSRGLNEKSINNYMSQITRFLLTFKGDIDNKKDLENFILDFYSNKRCYLIRFALKYLFEYLDRKYNKNYQKIYEKIIERNKYVFREKARIVSKKFVTKNQIKNIIEAMGKYNPEYKLFLLIQYETACRGGALINLKKFDVEKRGDRAVITLKEKRGSNQNFILSEELSIQLLEKVERCNVLASVWNFSFSCISKVLKKVSLKEFGYSISTHYFRSSRAVHLLQEGYDIITIMNLLRHKRIDTTYRYLKESGIGQEKLVNKKNIGWLYE